MKNTTDFIPIGDSKNYGINPVTGEVMNLKKNLIVHNILDDKFLVMDKKLIEFTITKIDGLYTATGRVVSIGPEKKKVAKVCLLDAIQKEKNRLYQVEYRKNNADKIKAHNDKPGVREKKAITSKAWHIKKLKEQEENSTI